MYSSKAQAHNTIVDVNAVDFSLSENLLCVLDNDKIYFKHLDQFKPTATFNWTTDLYDMKFHTVRNVMYFYSSNLVTVIGENQEKLAITIYIINPLNIRFNLRTLNYFFVKQKLGLEGTIIHVELSLNLAIGRFSLILFANEGIAFFDITVEENECSLHYLNTIRNRHMFIPYGQKIKAAHFFKGIIALQIDDFIMVYRFLDLENRV